MPLWKYGNMRHKSTRFLKSNFRIQVALKLWCGSLQNYMHILRCVACPGPGWGVFGTGEPATSLWSEECAGRRMGGIWDVTTHVRCWVPSAWPPSDSLKSVTVKMSSLYSLLISTKCLLGTLLNMSYFSVLGFNVMGRWPVVQESGFSDRNHPG